MPEVLKRIVSRSPKTLQRSNSRLLELSLNPQTKRLEREVLQRSTLNLKS